MSLGFRAQDFGSKFYRLGFRVPGLPVDVQESFFSFAEVQRLSLFGLQGTRIWRSLELGAQDLFGSFLGFTFVNL